MLLFCYFSFSFMTCAIVFIVCSCFCPILWFLIFPLNLVIFPSCDQLSDISYFNVSFFLYFIYWIIIKCKFRNIIYIFILTSFLLKKFSIVYEHVSVLFYNDKFSQKKKKKLDGAICFIFKLHSLLQ